MNQVWYAEIRNKSTPKRKKIIKKLSEFPDSYGWRNSQIFINNIICLIWYQIRKSLKEKALNRTRYNKQCPNLLYLLPRSQPFSKALRFYYNNESHHPIKFIIVCFGFFLTQELDVDFVLIVWPKLFESTLKRIFFFSVRATPTEYYVALYFINCYHVFHCASVIVHTVQKQLKTRYEKLNWWVKCNEQIKAMNI